MGRTVADLLATRGAQVVGRVHELAVLGRLLEGEAPVVAFVHGPPGIGKSCLLQAFADEARRRGLPVIHLDCGAVEPTPEGFRAAVAQAMGGPSTASPSSLLGERCLLLLDRYERFRLLDTWIRQDLLPAAGAGVRVAIASREAPVAAWWAAPGWRDLLLRLPLGPLGEDDARLLLRSLGLADEDAETVNRLVRGHPLGLVVAGAAGSGSVAGRVGGDGLLGEIVEALTGAYLDDLDRPTRRALQAAALVRRLTLPLLRAMLAGGDPEEAYERLRRLPFVQVTADGLAIHETVQAVAAASLRAADPPAHRGMLRAAWAQLRAELADARPEELWRYTADMIWLVGNPVVREAFFPSEHQRLAVEPVTGAEEQAVRALLEAVEPVPDPLLAWWRHLPTAFHVVRDASGAVTGLYLLAEAEEVPPAVEQADVIARRWLDHLRRAPVPGRQRVLLLRRWLDGDGDGPSPVQAACWLDVKRRYLELRPELRRIYTVTTTPEPYLPVVTTLGFHPLPEADVALGGVDHVSVMLDFGPGSVDGWLSRLAAAELGVDDGDVFDADRRQVVVGDRRVDLTRLEHGVLEVLAERRGRVVTRPELLASVWGHDVDVGSNVVDVVVRSLRRKLGDRAGLIATVRGHGYRLDDDIR